MAKLKDLIKKLKKSFKRAIYAHSKTPNFESLYGGGVYEKIAEESAKADKFAND